MMHLDLRRHNVGQDAHGLVHDGDRSIITAGIDAENAGHTMIRSGGETLHCLMLPFQGL